MMTNSEKQAAIVTAIIAAIVFTSLLILGGGVADVSPSFFWEPE